MTLCLASRAALPAHVAPPHSARPRIAHAKCPPCAALAPFVEHYWVTRWDRRGAPAREASSLLDSCVHLQVQNGRAHVMGVARGTYRLRIEDVGCIIGVKFRPGGFQPFVQRPVSEWTDRVVRADEVFVPSDAPHSTAWAQELWDAVIQCDGNAAAHSAIAAAHLDAFLLQCLPERDADAERASVLVAMIATNADMRRVSDLARASGRSERTLHRLFVRYVGASPAWVIRRYRLTAAAARLTAQPPADVRTVAWELGYADQAHFIRDFRATIGVTPGAYVQGRMA